MDARHIAEAAALLVNARRANARIPQARRRPCRPTNVTDAHAIQDAVTATLGTPIGAFKATARAPPEPGRPAA